MSITHDSFAKSAQLLRIQVLLHIEHHAPTLILGDPSASQIVDVLAKRPGCAAWTSVPRMLNHARFHRHALRVHAHADCRGGRSAATEFPQGSRLKSTGSRR